MQDAAAEVASGAMRAQGLEIELDGVETCWLNALSLLLALKDGQLWQANLVLANNIVDELKVDLCLEPSSPSLGRCHYTRAECPCRQN